jgi:murein DD-endopeptidase MepM/ murein hydrolase activator NlpD
MNEEKKTSKKSILTYYLIAGISLLVIAALTVGIILAVNYSRNRSVVGGEIEVEGGSDDTAQTPSEGVTDATQTPSEGANGGSDEQDQTQVNGGGEDDNSAVSVVYNFATPSEGDIINGYTFYKNKTLDCYHFHTGVDYSAEVGTAVTACLDGVVESITTGSPLDGTVITISHSNGMKSVYKFVDANEDLNIGDSVTKGQVIATVASPVGSEYKDGAHLHFELYDGDSAIDPEEYITSSLK